MNALFLDCKHAYFIDFDITEGTHYALCARCLQAKTIERIGRSKGVPQTIHSAWRYVIGVKPVRNVPERTPVFLSRGWVFRTKPEKRGKINSNFIYRRRVA